MDGWMDGRKETWMGEWMDSTISRNNCKYKETELCKARLGERLRVGKSIRKLLPASPGALMLHE